MFSDGSNDIRVSWVVCQNQGLYVRTKKRSFWSCMNVFSECPNLFKGLGHLPGEIDIKVDPTVTPVVHPPRKVPIALREPAKKELDRMEKNGYYSEANRAN